MSSDDAASSSFPYAVGVVCEKLLGAQPYIVSCHESQQCPRPPLVHQWGGGGRFFVLFPLISPQLKKLDIAPKPKEQRIDFKF